MNLTIPQIIKTNSEKWGTETAMCIKDRGIWQQYRWLEYYEKIKFFALGLASLGLQTKDVVCIIGDNEPEWFWGEFAVQAAGGIATGIFVDSIPSEVKYIASHSSARFAIVNDQEQADKFIEIYDELKIVQEFKDLYGQIYTKEIPQIINIIYWDPKGLKNYTHPALVSFDEVISLGKEYEKSHPELFEETLNNGSEDDIAFIYYTSGTTGLPKGAILTHRSLVHTALGFISIYPLTKRDNLVSSFPAAWVGDSYFATLPHLLTGAVLNFAEEPDTIAEDTREIGPNFVIYGPRQWESLVSEIQVKITDANAIKQFFYKLFMPVGYKFADISFAGDKPNYFWKMMHFAAYFLLFRPLKDKIGLSHVRFAVTGSSVLSLDTFRLIHALGIELRQSYASTEAGFISSHSKGEIDFQSVGRPAPGTEVRLTDDGELFVKSDCLFSEYYKDETKTASVLANGWCKTGDAVNINEEGHLIFLDRLEHLGELASGTKYAPQYIEGRLRFSPYIKDAMVIGGKNRQFVSAIINIDFAMVSKWAERHHLPFTTFVDLSQKEKIADLIKRDLLRVNSYLPEPARVKKFVLLHKEFDADESELTRTKKLRRDFIEKRYNNLIEAAYSDQDSIHMEASVTYRDGRKGVVSTLIKIRSV
jgi:long-chain acyl-CoA synthetase